MGTKQTEEKEIEEALKRATWNYDPTLGHFLSSKGVKALLASLMHSIRLATLTELNPVELAERIVIEYANISGRESENRTFVREASIKVITDIINELKKKE